MSNQPEMNPISDMAVQALKRQLLGGLDMLSNAMSACPARLWQARLWPVSDLQGDFSTFWSLGFHTLFWFDLYLEGGLEGFAPPEPFNLDELDPAFVLPSRVYTPDELQTYLAHGRAKCLTRLNALDAIAAGKTSGFTWLPCSYFEVQLYNMRHVQEHSAQLNMFLGQTAGIDARWVKFGAV